MGFVGNDHLRIHVLEQDILAVQIRGLSRREHKACGIAQRILRGVDLGAQLLGCVRGPAPRPPLSASAVRVGSHDGRADHGVFVVRMLRKCLEDTLPHPASAPAHVAQVHHPEIDKALGQVVPGDTSAIATAHGIDEQPIVIGRGCDMPSLTGQQVLDSAPLAICQSVSAIHAPDSEASIEFDDAP